MMRSVLIGTLRWLPAIGWLVVLVHPCPPAAQGQSFDSQLVSRGRIAFQEACTQCHDADRAFQKRKSASGWLTTVRRMARLDDADISASDIIPIATFLAARNAPTQRRNRAPQSQAADAVDVDAAESDADSDPSSQAADLQDGETDAESDEDGDDVSATAPDDQAWTDLASEVGSGLSTSTTLSPLWRNGNDNLENPNFFVDAWFRADWQPSGPLRARATACTSCHSDQSGGAGFTLELVEAYAALDLLKKFHGCRNPDPDCAPRLDAEIRAGRFIVPFGAFSSMSHPGSYGAVTAPLVFNMGRQVNPDNGRPPVLPMPYSDEGVDVNTKLQYKDCTATLDIYGVNGLQGFGPGIQFTPSRSYTDNNSDVALGSRATVGNKFIRFGGSLMSGRMQDEGSPNLSYHLSGADATARFFDDQLRLYFEYAIRRNDSNFGTRQISYGTITELDALLLEHPNLRMLVRYDTLEHRDFFGSQGIRRFTWGASTTVLAGSTLIINHEHWRFSNFDRDTDVLGFRWVTVF